MSTFPESVLLGDIGATNARLALATETVLGPITTFEVNRFARFPDVVNVFLRDHSGRSRLSHALFRDTFNRDTDYNFQIRTNLLSLVLSRFG